MKRLYVGNLVYNANEEDIRNAFAPYGEVTSVHVVMDRETGRSRGFAFVEMEDNAGADQAVEALNGCDFGGRDLVVNEARPRPERTGGGGGGGFGGGGGGRGRGPGGGGGGGGRSREPRW